MRILITGSRKWRDYDAIARAITVAISDLIKQYPDDNIVTIVHGDCPEGADAYADEFANKISRLMLHPREKTNKQYIVKVEKHPAEWDKYGKSAGPKRNEQMVNAGADICLAFNKNNSPGTSGTIKLVEKAGIELREYKA